MNTQINSERRDAMLARTGPAARAILTQIKKLPSRQQVAALDRVLANYEPGLPARMRRAAGFFHRKGMPVDQAVERALSLSLADATIERIQKLGHSYRRGEVLPMGGLGQDSTSGASGSEKSAGKVVAGMFQGIVCSNQVQASVTDLVGRREGASAASNANLGFEVGQGFAQCANLTPAPPPIPPTDAPAGSGGSMAVPVAVGIGALIVVGGAVWYSRKK